MFPEFCHQPSRSCWNPSPLFMIVIAPCSIVRSGIWHVWCLRRPAGVGGEVRNRFGGCAGGVRFVSRIGVRRWLPFLIRKGMFALPLSDLTLAVQTLPLPLLASLIQSNCLLSSRSFLSIAFPEALTICTPTASPCLLRQPHGWRLPTRSTPSGLGRERRPSPRTSEERLGRPRENVVPRGRAPAAANRIARISGRPAPFAVCSPEAGAPRHVTVAASGSQRSPRLVRTGGICSRRPGEASRPRPVDPARFSTSRRPRSSDTFNLLLLGSAARYSTWLRDTTPIYIP